MKLIGNHTSPWVRKISVILLEKGIAFEFVNDNPWIAESVTPRYNPLGKVPALVTTEGECWFDSPIIVQYLELPGRPPALLPHDPLAALKVRQLEALADGIMDAALTIVREQQRPAVQQSVSEMLRQREKISRGLDRLEQLARDGILSAEPLDVANIAVACALSYLNFRQISPGWCAERPNLVQLSERLLARESFARTQPPAP